MARFTHPGSVTYGIQILDAHETYEDFIAEHPTGDPGDAHLVGDHLYSWNSETNTWIDAGHIVGPPGATGATGPQGIQGPQGATGATGAAGGFGSYGSWYDTSDQFVNTLSVGQPVLIRTQDLASGFTRTNDSRITANNTGVYNIAFSFQFHNRGGGGNGTTAEIWLTKNGQPVPDTNTRLAVITNSPYIVAAWNFFIQLNAGDYTEIYWATDNNSIVLEHNTGSMGGPAIPSTIITINQVG